MNHDCVSIIIPVHNAEKFISDTIQSIRSQTYTDWELILVDDCSKDHSVEIMTQLSEHTNRQNNKPEQVRIIKHSKGMGAACARNTGLCHVRGRYVAFLDADDLWDPEKLSLQLAFMEEKHCAFSFTGYEFAGSDGVGVDKIVQVPDQLKYRQALKNTTIFTSTVMFDITKIPIGLIRMPQVPSEDTATWWKILRSGYTAYGLKAPLTLYRRSEGTLSSNKVTAIKRVWNLYRNVEHLGILYSFYCFCFYAVHAVWRRL